MRFKTDECHSLLRLSRPLWQPTVQMAWLPPLPVSGDVVVSSAVSHDHIFFYPYYTQHTPRHHLQHHVERPK